MDDGEDDKKEKCDHFLSLITVNWPYIFHDAEKKIASRSAKVLRKPLSRWKMMFTRSKHMFKKR